MSDVDRIIEQLLNDRRTQESALFSSRTFADQPLIERGRDLQERMRRRERSRDLQERMKQRDEERSERRQRAAEQRQAQRQQRQAEPSQTKHQAQAEPNYQTSLWQSELNRTLRDDPTPTLIQHREAPLPEPLREMRQLENTAVAPSLVYGRNASAHLFYKQARLLEDYEDDYEFDGSFFQYYPTYVSMTNHQLRGYFSWRTRVRAGSVEQAPLSFAFVYVYELLCGIGTTPGPQGLADLRAFGEAYAQASPYDGNRLMRYLRGWTHDYAIYHEMPSELSQAPHTNIDQSALTLLAAEHALLREAGLEPKFANGATDPDASPEAPSPEELYHALSAASTYRLDQARLAKDEPELLVQVSSDVFAALVMHCAKRRRVDFVEGLFGFSYNLPVTMFSSAIFYEPTPHPDCCVKVSPVESYICTDGRWRHQMALEATDRDSELGRYLHTIDYELRQQLDYAYPLKPRKVPKYIQNMVRKATTKRLKERAEAEEARRRAEEEAEKRRITIDRSKLHGIRAAAAQTQEALLTDEERGMEPVAPAAPIATPALATEAPAQAGPASAAASATQVQPPANAAPATLEPVAATPSEPAPAVPASATPTPDATCEAVVTYGLSALELRVLEGLLAQTPATELLGPGDPFVSVVVDSINEKLFDLVGDTLIEFDGDEPSLIEDYLDDIREVL